MSKIAVYPGTFDPITNGHIDLVKRAAKLFQTVIVAVAASARKLPYFSLEDRLFMARDALLGLTNVSVCPFSCLLVHFAQQQGAGVIIRGIRAVSDFEYEFQMAGINRQMAPNIETLFLTPLDEYANLSSSMVREVALLGGDVAAFVPTAVYAKLGLQSAIQKKEA